jgi:hypothetical protein
MIKVEIKNKHLSRFVMANLVDLIKADASNTEQVLTILGQAPETKPPLKTIITCFGSDRDQIMTQLRDHGIVIDAGDIIDPQSLLPWVRSYVQKMHVPAKKAA